jgi:hypothetical protein
MATAAPAASTTPSASAADQALAALPVKGRAKTGYSRERFGQRRPDVDRHGCGQRDDVLARDMTDKTFEPGTHNCVVLTGHVHDPYSGEGHRVHPRPGHQ